MPTSLHQRQKSSADPFPISPPSSNSYGFHFSQRTAAFFSRPVLLALVSLLVLLGLLLPSTGRLSSLFSPSKLPSTSSQRSKWRDYTLADAADFVGKKKGTVIVCAVSQPYLPFLSNWLISISRQKHQDEVLVIAEDYATLYQVNEKWPGHAVLVPPAPDAQTAHKFGSQVKPLDHPHDLPPPNKKGRTYICSCMIYLRPTDGAKLVMKKWIEELKEQPWSKKIKSNDQPAFNWALNKTAGEVDLYLLPQAAFPSGGLYFKNKTWVKETKGMHVIIHNNYIIGFEKKIKRFREFGLWLVDDFSDESPLGKIT